MLNTRIVEIACRRYAVQGVLTTVVLSLMVVALSMWLPEWNLIVPMIVTDIFSLTVCIVEALVLRCVAQHDTENLHNFFIAATGIRMSSPCSPSPGAILQKDAMRCSLTVRYSCRSILYFLFTILCSSLVC